MTVVTRGSPPEESNPPPPPPPPPHPPSSPPSVAVADLMEDMPEILQEPTSAPPGTPTHSSSALITEDRNNGVDISSGSVENLNDDASEDADAEICSFPTDALRRLDEFLSLQRWVVPVLPNQELHQLIEASIVLCKCNLDGDDEACQRFFKEGLLLSFTRVMTDEAVKGWKQEILRHIYKVSERFLELCVIKLDDVPVFLDILALLFNPRNRYHTISQQRIADSVPFDCPDSTDLVLYARSPDTGCPKGWLVDLINKFGQLGGFQKVFDRFCSNANLTCSGICALLKPFGMCADFLLPKTVETYFEEPIRIAHRYMQTIGDEELKRETKGDSRENSPMELVRYLRNLSSRLPGQENVVRELELLRLKIILRTLQASSFAGKMNALNEISKILQSVSSSPSTYGPSEEYLNVQQVVSWIRDNDLLSVAIKENLHILQYVEKLEKILRFMIREKTLTVEDLDQLWAAQTGKHDAIVKNVHDLLAKVAWDFSAEQLDHLFDCFQKSWNDASKKQREKLLELIRRLAEDDREGRCADKVLQLLWNLARSNGIPTDIMDQALQCHAKILDYTCTAQKEQQKIVWLEQCIEEIRGISWVLPAMKHFREICVQIPDSTSTWPCTAPPMNRVRVVANLQNTHSLVALISDSLVLYMEFIRAQAQDGNMQLDEHTVAFDHRYEHPLQIHERLSFLKFVLRDGQLWLCDTQAKQIWDALIVNPIFPSDREAGFKWFVKMMGDMPDLDPEIQRKFFDERVLQLDSLLLSENGIRCFERFFKHVNQQDHRLMMSELRFPHINSFDLLGQEYLWRVVLTTDDEIANRAIDLVREVYTSPKPEMIESGKLPQLHMDFIQNCIDRLKASYDTLSVLCREKDKENAKLIRQETTRMTRVLRVLDAYIVAYDEQYNEDRQRVPLYRASLGRSISLVVHFPSSQGKHQALNIQPVEMVTHSNHTLARLRKEILHAVRLPAGISSSMAGVRVELSLNGESLDNADDRKILEELGLFGRMELQAKLHQNNRTVRAGENGSSPGTSSGESSPGASPMLEKLGDGEYENLMPSTWLCQKHEQIEFLLQIADMGSKLESDTLRECARAVLRAVPGDMEFMAKLLAFTEQTTPVAGAPPGIGNLSTPVGNGLQSVFFASSSSEVLYCLELMYAMLVPAKDFNSNATLAFQTNFVKAGGLQLCLATLLRNNFLSQADALTKSCAFWHVLRLLRLLLSVQLYVRYQICYNAVNRAPSDDGGAEDAKPQDIHKQFEYIQGFLTILPAQVDALLSRVCQSWADRLGGYTVPEQTPELDHARMVIKLAWSAAAGSPALYNVSNTDDIHAAFAKNKDISSDSQAFCREALEVFTLCAVLNPSIMDVLLRDKFFQQCVIDLLFSTSEHVRTAAGDQFFVLATKSYLVQPRVFHFFINLLFTVLFTTASENSQICREYFILLRGLLVFASNSQINLQLVDKEKDKEKDALNKEVTWLLEARNYTLTNMESYPDELLLEGHLMITRALVGFLSPQRKDFIGSVPDGPLLVKKLLEDFLLPSSRMFVEQKGQPIQRSVTIMENITESSGVSVGSTLPRSMTTIYSPNRCVPVCGTSQTVTAAYELVVALCTNCVSNMKATTSLLDEMYFNDSLLSVTEWEYAPPVSLRNASLFVGLKNGGATCYMNSVFQQLFMIEPLRNCILNSYLSSGQIEDSDNEENMIILPIVSKPISSEEMTESVVIEKKSAVMRQEYNMGVLRCVQLIFANLLGSQLQFYVPKSFWKHFRFGNEQVNLREQHDALEFFNSLVDSIDEALKAVEQPQICNKIFGGTFADQKICKGCPHRYSREEPFTTLSLDVRNHHTLLDSLQEYVKGDLLESENAYLCEKCNRKVDAIKRLCIKKLPPLLAIQLKRFDFDWEREQAIKFNDYFEFPRQIDMEPYTAEGLAKLDGVGEVLAETVEENDTSTTQESKSTHYKLRGIIVHSGQASGGHYYSFITQRMSNDAFKWFKFDDGDVTECRMDDDEEMRNQCFGGEYTSEVFDQYLRRMQQRRHKRWWNAYILFYEREDFDETVLTKDFGNMSLSGRLRQMPPTLEEIVNRKNMKCCHKRNQYTSEFFHFMRQLCFSQVAHVRNSQNITDDMYIQFLLQLSMQLVSKFLFTTALRAKRCLRGNAQDWADIMMWLFRLSYRCRTWFASEILFKNPRYFAEYLLECPSADVRQIFYRVLLNLAQYSTKDYLCNITGLSERYPKPEETLSDKVIQAVLALLNKEVSEYGRHLKEYFSLFYQYASMGIEERRQLLKFHVPLLFIRVALDEGPGPPIRSIAAEMHKLYSTVSLLIRSCDLSPYCRTSDDSPVAHNPYQDDIKQLLSVEDSPNLIERLYESPPKFLKKLVEDSLSVDDSMKLIKFLCWENLQYSHLVFSVIFQQIRQGFYELRPLLDCLLRVLMLEDSWAEKRIFCGLRGTEDYDGLFSFIQTQCTHNPRRGYILIKMLTFLFSESEAARRVLQDHGELKRRWVDVVSWMHTELTRRNTYVSQYVYNSWNQSNQSNETATGLYLERTKSAKLTFTKASYIAQSYCSDDKEEQHTGERWEEDIAAEADQDPDDYILGTSNAATPSHPPPSYTEYASEVDLEEDRHRVLNGRLPQSQSDSAMVREQTMNFLPKVTVTAKKSGENLTPEKVSGSLTVSDLSGNFGETGCPRSGSTLKRSAASTEVNMAGSREDDNNNNEILTGNSSATVSKTDQNTGTTEYDL